MAGRQKYFGNWSTYHAVLESFFPRQWSWNDDYTKRHFVKRDVPADFPTPREVVFAAYDNDNEGSAIVIYRRKRKLYEVNASHCSCYGLSEPGSWRVEQTSVAALKIRRLSSLHGSDSVAAFRKLFSASSADYDQ